MSAPTPPLVPARDAAQRPLATWNARRPWLLLILIAFGGVVFTVIGSALGVILELSLPTATLLTAGCVAVSALVGLGVMRASAHPVTTYGFRTPIQSALTGWTAPLWLTPIIVVLVVGYSPDAGMVVPYLLLAIAVGFNEEIWFRGLALAAVRRLGTKTAIIGSAIAFAVMHLFNALSGAPLPYLILQFGFSLLVGFVLAEILAITGSLWIVIAWHAVYDTVSFLAGNDVDFSTEVRSGVLMTVILLCYAIYLWRRLPTEHR